MTEACKMEMTPDQAAMLRGERGEIMQKIMETLVRYGEAFGAKRMVALDGPTHSVSSYALINIKPHLDMLEDFARRGIRTVMPFTCNPRPCDYDNILCDEEENRVLREIFALQPKHEEVLKQIGHMNERAYTCTPYMEEVGNVPKRGDMLAWAESSAVVYVNSVIGARTNRTSSLIDLFSAIVGATPLFGLLTDEGRKADWVVELKTGKLPRAHVLGSAIGMKVLDQVPYIKGLDRFLGCELNGGARDYLKDMGSSTASNGAVPLYHVENLTPEAVDFGEALVREKARVYVIDDAELERVRASYPNMWKNADGEPEMAFVGCPHSSYDQLCQWAKDIEAGLKRANGERLAVYTVFSAAQDVLERFKKSEFYPGLVAAGAYLTYICPLNYCMNPLSAKRNIITNSNKLRTYSHSRYLDDEDLLKIIVGEGGLRDEGV